MAKAKAVAKPKMGRPSKYTPALAQRICTKIAQGKSLVSVLKAKGMPDYTTVARWLAHPDHEEFRQMYTRAREDQADYLADELVQIADTAKDRDSAAAAKVRTDTRKWVAAKLKPRKYGERVTQEHTGPEGSPLNPPSLTVNFVSPESEKR
ncbi:MAG: hypothetical protein RBR18_17145 [Desulfovibrionaceae bacterium]|nr:hypothetical protein [Desulfovibrionaceae bacterium]